MPLPHLRQIVLAGLVLVLAALIVATWRHLIAESVALLVLLTAVLVNAAAFGFWLGLASALGAFGIFNFFLVEPHYSFLTTRPQDVVMLMAFLAAAALTGSLAGRLREQVDAARGRAAVLEVLASATGDLATAATRADVVARTARHLAALSGGAAVAIGRRGESLEVLVALPAGFSPDPVDLQAAEQALARGRVEFATAEGWTGSHLTFHPVPPGKGSDLAFGAAPVAETSRDYGYREQAIGSVLQQAHAALDRIALARAAEEERLARDNQTMRAALLSSLSHDLRTPLATILGSVTTLRELHTSLPPAAQDDLLRALEEEARRLARYVEKLLQMTKLMMGVSAELHPVDAADCAQAAVARARRAFGQIDVVTDLPELPLVRAEAALVEQVVFSLIENAVRSASGPIRVTGAQTPDQIRITVADTGPGLPDAVAAWLTTPDLAPDAGRSGLGLPICKGIARALGGTLTAERAGPETRLTLALPLPGTPS